MNAKTQVGNIGPVTVVMHGKKALLGVITHLVGRHAHFFGPFLRKGIHFQKLLLGGDWQLSFLSQGIEAGSFFDD